VRNLADLEGLACPPKYRKLGDFHRYYSGELQAPVLTVFVGGNHEASNHMWELYYGGWVCPNIYYMGAANSIKFGPLRISGVSGIYKHHDYPKGHFERGPFSMSDQRSIYHVRHYDVFKLEQLTPGMDVFLSHDWPVGITAHGDEATLLKRKPFFRPDIQSGKLGSPASKNLLRKLYPRHWFAAHMHTRFQATVPSELGATNFLALDKCLPNREYLECIDLPDVDATDARLEYDPEWLAITKALNPWLSVDYPQTLPKPDEMPELLSEARAWVDANVQDLVIPNNFLPTVPAAGDAVWTGMAESAFHELRKQNVL
jgi:lariat debranching enzyme